MTNEQFKRIQSAIIETKVQLNKELSYRSDLQKRDLIAFYVSHIEKLNKMLEA